MLSFQSSLRFGSLCLVHLPKSQQIMDETLTMNFSGPNVIAGKEQKIYHVEVKISQLR